MQKSNFLGKVISVQYFRRNTDKVVDEKELDYTTEYYIEEWVDYDYISPN